MQAKQFQMRLNWFLGFLERSFIVSAQLSQLATRLSVRGPRALWNSDWWTMIYLTLPCNSLVGLMASSPFWSIATYFSMNTLKLLLFKSVSSVRTGEKCIIFLTLLWSVPAYSSSSVSKRLEEVRRCFRLGLRKLSKVHKVEENNEWLFCNRHAETKTLFYLQR